MIDNQNILLGITSGSESGICLFLNNKLTAAVSEERFTRIKNDHEYPFHSINWILQTYGINNEAVIQIAYGFTNGLNVSITDIGERLSEYPNELLTINFYKILFERYNTEFIIDSNKKNHFITNTRKIFPNCSIFFEYHHNSHRSAAFFNSNFTHSYILTCDGRGDGKSLTFSQFTPGVGFEEIYFANHWESLGYFYGRITHLCGFTPNRHEGKVTGLAAHGNPNRAKELVSKMIYFKEGKIYTNLGSYYTPFFTNFSKELINAANEFSREDLAAAAQIHLEEILTSLIKYYTKHTESFNLCVAGGVFANVRLNSVLKNIDGLNNYYVFPNMSDGGIAVGACYSYIHSSTYAIPSPNNSMFIGPIINPDKLITLAISNNKVHLTLIESKLLEMCIDILLKGGLIALCKGESEFGPRALGNRSLLALPIDKSITKKINHSLSRDDFMPLAPVMLTSVAKELLLNFDLKDSTAEYMVSTFQASDQLKKKSPAVVHIDGTCRAQIINYDENDFLSKLLDKLYKDFSIDCLINTSFNLHEEPIVSDHQSAFNTFIISNIDALVCPPVIILK